jgi:hypothetical protein
VVDAPAKIDRRPHRELTILEDALAAFTRTTGLRARLGEQPRGNKGNHRADAVVEFEAHGRRYPFFAEVKAVDRATTLATIKERLTQPRHRGLLVAPYLTPELAHRCREIDLPFIDMAGNAYVRMPDLVVFVKGEKRPEYAITMGTRGGGTATALRVVFALLCRPELLNVRYREIVDAAGVALGAVGPVFLDLQRRGYVAGGQRKGQRRFLEAKRLLDEWVTTYPIKLRPKLNPRRFTAANADWWKTARLPNGAYWGGELAADRLINHLKPAAFTIYLDPAHARENLTKLVVAHRLRADPAGEIEILDMFWNFEADGDHPDLVPALLIYADLLATLDPRNLEAARLLRDHPFGDALRQP